MLGCEIDATDSFDVTQLMCAATNGHTECLQLLIQRGADVRKRDKDGRTAAHHAALRGRKELLLALLDAGCEIDGTDRSDMTPLMCAADEGHTECLQLLIQRGADANKRDKDGRTAAHFAAWRGYKETLLALLASECEINATDYYEVTPLLYAADHGHSGCLQLQLMSAANHVECLQLLMQRGADVHKCKKDGRTAAHCAAERGNVTALEVLATFDSDVLSPLTLFERWTVADCAASESRVDALSYTLACGCRLSAPCFVLQASVPWPLPRVMFSYDCVPL